MGKSTQSTVTNIITLLFAVNLFIGTQAVASNEWHTVNGVVDIGLGWGARLKPLFGGGDCSAPWLLMPSARARISIDVWKNIKPTISGGVWESFELPWRDLTAFDISVGLQTSPFGIDPLMLLVDFGYAWQKLYPFLPGIG